MSNMRITDVIVNWLEAREWEERPEIDEENQTSSTSFTYNVGDFSVKCFLDASENAGFCKLFIYFLDSKIPEKHLDEVLKFVNKVNCKIYIGALHLIQEERIIRYYASIDVENAAFEPQHIQNMIGAGLGVMEYRLPQYMAICFGGKTAEEALEIEPEQDIIPRGLRVAIETMINFGMTDAMAELNGSVCPQLFSGGIEWG